MGDIIAGDVEDADVIEHAANDDVGVGVGMAGVVMIDRDPVETGGEIQFHLAHEVTSEAAKVLHLGGIFGRDHEAELMAVASASLHLGMEHHGIHHLYPAISLTKNAAAFREMKPILEARGCRFDHP